MYKKGLFGFFSLDLLSFPDPYSDNISVPGESLGQLFWANSLGTYFSDAHAAYILGSVVTGRFEENLDQYITVLPHLPYHTLPTVQFKSFFHSTRLDYLFFDVVTKTGVLFLLSRSLQSGMMGIVAVENTPDSSCALVVKALNFLRRQTEPEKKVSAATSWRTEGDLCTIDQIYGKLKVDMKGILSTNHTLANISQLSRVQKQS